VKNPVSTIETHAILKSKLKLNYSKQSKVKSNWPDISVTEIEIEIHFTIEVTLMYIEWLGSIISFTIQSKDNLK
jgi:hypothetical protein